MTSETCRHEIDVEHQVFVELPSVKSSCESQLVRQAGSHPCGSLLDLNLFNENV